LIIAFLFLQTIYDIVSWDKFIYFWGNFWIISQNEWTLSALNPMWSISIEEHFYLFIPFILLIIPVKYLKYLFVSIILTSIGFRIYATLTIPNNWMTIYMHTFSQMDLLAMGGLLAFYHHQHKLRFNISFSAYLLFLSSFVLLLTLLDTKDYSNLYYASFKKYVFSIPLLFLLMLYVFSNHNSFNWIKNNRIFNYFGKISYGIYMFNALVIDLLDRIGWLRTHYYVKLPLDIILTLLIASISFEFFEKHFLKLKTKFQKNNLRVK
jgi:peptidoglycan/LPS O-acetylase OafA/YrhL